MDTADALATEPIDRIVRGARECFARSGVRKAVMAQIARAAGMVRQTLYDYVANREELVELALLARLHELAAEIVERSDATGPARQAMTEQLAQMAEAVRDDPECAWLLDGLSYQHAAQFITAHDSVQEVVIVVLAPLRDRASREGCLRGDLTLDEMGWWTRTALLPLSSQQDLSSEQLRDAVARFVLPAFLRDDS